MDRKIIVSLTSYPARIKSVHKVIDSLIHQSIKANKIILWLSEAEFPKRENDLTQELINLIGINSFEVRWVRENLRSHKKYFYVLQECSQKIVITVDDDIYYDKDMIKELVESYRKHPFSISARKARIMLKNNENMEKYQNWYGKLPEYVDQERMDICAIGVGGVLYPPNCSNKRWFCQKKIIGLALKQDDLWLKCNELIDGITAVYTGGDKKDITIEGTQEEALCKENLYESENDQCIDKLSRFLWKEYNGVWQLCKDSFMNKISFWNKKGEFYTNQINSTLSKYITHKVYICGAGKYAQIMYAFLEQYNLDKKIEAFLVTQNEDKKELCNKSIQWISNLQKDEKFVVLCGVNEKNKGEIKSALAVYKSCVWIDTDIKEIIKILRAVEEMS